MPRHPPIALKTLDRSHCQCPPARSRGIVASAKSCAGFHWMGLAQKDQLLETCPGARLGKPIISGRLSVSPRQTRAIDVQPAECRNNREPHSSQGVRTNLLFTMSCRTCGGPKPATKPLSNDCHPLYTTRQSYGLRGYGGAGRDRTDDPLLAKQVLSQLSYGP